MHRPLRNLVALALSCLFAHAGDAPDPTVAKVLTAIHAEDIKAIDDRLVAFGTRNTLSDATSDTRGIGAARRWIKSELDKCAAKSDGRMTVEFDEYEEPAGARLKAPVKVVNVVATLKGTAEPERVLVVSGHYDSRGTDVMDTTRDAPGADDDASGTAATMAMACAFAPHRWPATLVFMTVAGEEQGLWGANHYAETAARNRRNIIGMITNDIIGTPVGDQGQRDDMQVRLFADGFSPLLKMMLSAQQNHPMPITPYVPLDASRAQLETIARSGGGADTPTAEWGRYLKDAAERYLPGFHVKLIGRADRFLRGGDHLPFLERGYPAVRFTEPFENFAHQHQDVRLENGVQYGDLTQYVEPAYVARVAQANAAGLASLALAPASPEGVGLEVTELTNDSTLRWQQSSDADVAGYRIYWREPDASTWQQSMDVGKVGRYTLKGVSKDNYVFGVAAVNATGEASLPVFPVPFR
ncbi:MAG: M28 family metallopeptidase [Burkholderiales bacterium]|nr:M28 family metallopeptidase [Burkholderiales bacterium]